MSVTINTGWMKYKNPNSGDYQGIDAIADSSTEDRVAAINSAGATQTAAINSAGSSQITAIEAKGTETRASIPSDYSTLSDDVEDLKSEVGNLSNLTTIDKSNLVSAINEAAASTTIQDGTVTPNMTTFIGEPFVYDTIEVTLIRGSVNESTGAITTSSSVSSGVTGRISIDLLQGASVKFAVTGGAVIRNRRVILYKDDVFVGSVAFSTTTDRGTIDLSAYVDTTEQTVSVNQICFQVGDYTQTAYISNSPNLTTNTLAALTKRYFAFKDNYKDEFYNALDLNNGGIKTDSIEDGAVTGIKFSDESIEPRKFSGKTNILDYSEIVYGKYLGNPGINGSQDLKNFIIWIPVEPGETYTVNFVPTNFYFYGFWKSDKTTHVGASNYSIDPQNSNYDISVPNNSAIAYMVLSGSNKNEVFQYGVLPKWKLWKKSYGEPESEYSFDWLKLSNLNKLRSSIFRGKIILATGDSITENNTRNNNKSWLMYLPEKIGVTVYNDGKSGTGLCKKYSAYHSILYRVENEWDTNYAGITPDIVLIMGNMNDGTGTGDGSVQSLNDLGISGWSSAGCLQVGNPTDDINTQSVYGCSKRFIEDVITKYPLAKIGWILSTPRNETISAWTGKTACYGHGWFHDYATAIKYQCEQYNVPVLDLYHESGFRPTNGTNMSAYMDDATTHPNTAGIKKYMVDPIVRWIENVFGEVS